MKSFTTLVLLASAALSTAQVTYNPNNGTYTCAIPNAAYCAGESGTNIIIRCIGTVGQPGNCNDNLAGEPPLGVNFSPCEQTSDTSGDAACSKNCIVYGGSGNANGTFTLPGCTPSYTSTVSSVSSASTTVSSSVTASSSVVPVVSYTTIVTLGTTVTVPCSSGTPILPSSLTAPATGISTITAPTGGASVPAGNGTAATSTSASASGSATATPVGPTTKGPATFTGAAVANQAGAVLAAGGLFIAYFL